jgi:hypothetical protein
VGSLAKNWHFTAFLVELELRPGQERTLGRSVTGNDRAMLRPDGASAMKTEKKIGRRDFLRALGGGAGVAVAVSGPLVEKAAAAEGESDEEKRKARYQADSPEVQNFYRVNRYPSK